MPISLDKWAANLAKRPLPALAVTIQRVKQLLENPNSSNHDFQNVIGLDPSFTMDIYRSFGVASGGKRGPASNIAHAISLLGPMPVKIAVNNLPILDKTLPQAAKTGIYQCYSRAAHAAIYAQDIGEQHGDNNPEEMGHTALLHNCAEMALWAYASKSMQMIHGLVRKGTDYGSASHSVLGFTLEQLPAVDKLVSETTLKQPQQELPKTAYGESLKEPLTKPSMEHQKESLNKAHTFPRERPAVAAERTTAKPAAESSINPAAFQVKPAAKAEDKTIAIKLVKPPNEWLECLQNSMRSMRNDLGLQRVMFAMLGPDQKRAEVGHLMGAAADSGLNGFSVSIKEKNLFSVLLSKQQGFWLRPENREKFLPMIPDEIDESIDKRGFFCMSIFVRNQPVGFVYADGREAMNIDCYTEFKQICANLSLDLGKYR